MVATEVHYGGCSFWNLVQITAYYFFILFFQLWLIRRCRFWAVGVLSQHLDAWSTWIYSSSPLWTTQRNYRRDKDFFHAWIKTLSCQCGKYAIINKIKCLAISFLGDGSTPMGAKVHFTIKSKKGEAGWTDPAELLWSHFIQHKIKTMLSFDSLRNIQEVQTQHQRTLIFFSFRFLHFVLQGKCGTSEFSSSFVMLWMRPYFLKVRSNFSHNLPPPRVYFMSLNMCCYLSSTWGIFLISEIS